LEGGDELGLDSWQRIHWVLGYLR